MRGPACNLPVSKKFKFKFSFPGVGDQVNKCKVHGTCRQKEILLVGRLQYCTVEKVGIIRIEVIKSGRRDKTGKELNISERIR